MTQATVLLSGGQDSATCLYWAHNRYDKVHAMSFNYGQSHAKELEFAKANAERVGATWECIDVRGTLKGSSLLSDQDHNEPHTMSDDLPSSFVPGRNLLFLTIAAGHAALEGCTTLVTGVCQTDFSGYPDCRRNTLDALEKALTLGIGLDFTIETPLMYLTKAQTFKMAYDKGCLDVIIEHTLTDYNGDMTLNEWGRGQLDNPASVLRAKGWEEAKAQGWVG